MAIRDTSARNSTSTSAPASRAASVASRSGSSRRDNARPTGAPTARSESARTVSNIIGSVNTPVSMCTAAELTAFKRKLSRVDPVLANLMRAAGKFTHVPNAEHTPFHALARAIAHQQLNGTAAESIFGRFVGLYPSNGATVALLEAELVLATPDEKLRAVGLSFAKIAGIKDLAQKTIDGTVPPYEILHTLADEEIIERLTQVRGIGRWTVEMLLMSRLGRPDILPVDDLGVRNGFRLAYGLRGMPT